ncbi:MULTISPECIES: phage holin family protein [Comamonas]|uniref:phage holin family protein n=1 Tax=Comamonas TaxID=283 RepID=UPI0002EBAE77|nr:MULTISPECIES: phage holin family protein [Comamonas]TFF63202.1 phage holin family protein [Comamonas sp. A23]
MPVNLISLLGLDSLLERWRANLNEAAIAAEDRVDLAQLEWQQHKRSMQTLAVLAIVLGALTVVVLIVLSMAVLVQFWDSEHRQLVAWLLVGGWVLVWGLGLWRLLEAVNQLSSPFRLTRRELKSDWQAMKERI